MIMTKQLDMFSFSAERAMTAHTARPERFPQVLRPYQQEALDGLMAAWEKGASAPLIVMATGMGKTTVIAEALRRLINPARQRALLIAHTEEIVFQLRDRLLHQFAGALDLDYAGAPGIGVVMSAESGERARIVCATRQSLHTRRLSNLLSFGAVDLIVIDEAHHVTGANTYADILDCCRAVNPGVRVFGVTATPARGDGKGLGAVFDAVACNYTMPRAIADGFLASVVSISVQTDVDLGRVATSAGDYNQAQLEQALDDADWLSLSVSAFVQHVPVERPTLAFFPSVRMSKAFSTALQARGIRAAHIDGETPKDSRRDILTRYRDGAINVIANVGVLTEGFDAPHTSCIFLARPTRSAALLTQIVGRGVRLYPGKSHCLVVSLSATDAKLASVVDLIGDLQTCLNCGVEHIQGVRVCPICGSVSVQPKQKRAVKSGETADPLTFNGVIQHLDSQRVSLFESLQSSWTIVGAALFSLSLGDNGLIRVQSSGLDDHGVEHWRCTYYPKGALEGNLIAVNTDAAALMGQAEAWVEARFPTAKRLTDKNATWRTLGASKAQLALIKKLTGRSAEAGLTRGQASAMIDALLSNKVKK